MTLGEKLQLLRRSRGLSQEQLAAELDVSRQAISKWECGDSTPDLDKLRAICAYFGVTADYLIWEKAEDAPTDSASAASGAAEPGSSEKRERIRAAVRRNGYWAGYIAAIIGGAMLLRTLIGLITVLSLMSAADGEIPEELSFFWKGPVRVMLPSIIGYLVLLAGGLAFAWWYRKKQKKRENNDDL